MHKVLDTFNTKITILEKNYPNDVSNFYSWRNCTYFLYKRRIAMTQEDIKWCEHVLTQHSSNTSS